MTRTRTGLVSATVLAALVAAPGTALASTHSNDKIPSAAKAGCKTGAVPDEVVGKPEVNRGGAAGDYIGHDGKGWTLFVTHPLAVGSDGKPLAKQAKVVYTGRITSSRPMHYVQRHLEKKDQVLISHDRKTIVFRFTNYGGLDGLRFTADCAASVKFAVNTDKAPTALTSIYLGKGKAHPASNPFTELRTKPVTTSPSPSASPSASPVTNT